MNEMFDFRIYIIRNKNMMTLKIFNHLHNLDCFPEPHFISQQPYLCYSCKIPQGRMENIVQVLLLMSS